MLRQSLTRNIPRPLHSGFYKPALLQVRGYADAPPPKQIKGAFLGKKNKDVHTIHLFGRILCFGEVEKQMLIVGDVYCDFDSGRWDWAGDQ